MKENLKPFHRKNSNYLTGRITNKNGRWAVQMSTDFSYFIPAYIVTSRSVEPFLGRNTFHPDHLNSSYEKVLDAQEKSLD